jgi:hypothetical protein
VPLMHVLAIHMKVMAPRQPLSDLWAVVTGLWLTGRDHGKIMLKVSISLLSISAKEF